MLALSLVLVGFYKVARNFNRPVIPTRVVQNPNTLIFLNYVHAMSQAQEKVTAVIHKNDVTDVAAITDRTLQAPAPDSRAIELRTTLLVILAKVADAAGKASPSPNGEQRKAPELDQLDAEFKQWKNEYNEWLKGAAPTYTTPQ